MGQKKRTRISIIKKPKKKTRVKRVEAWKSKPSTSDKKSIKSVKLAIAEKYTNPIRKRNWVLQKLRRASMAWPPKNEAKKRSWIRPGWHKCEGCGAQTHYKDLQMDHIEPVVDPVIGFVDLDTYVDRLFCGIEGFQGLCPSCHTSKTEAENITRKDNPKKKVDKKKKA